jgi:hypothetical protein
MKIRNYLIGKIKRNKILVVLILLGLITTSLGFYYNLIRESKTTYHYTLKDTKDKTQGLFFQRNSGINEDRNEVQKIFTFKKSSILNFNSSQVYYISDDSKFDQVFKYDFNTQVKNVIYENKNKENIRDIFLGKVELYILVDKGIKIFNLENKELNEIELLGLGKYNEFFNQKDSQIFLSYDKCKFVKEACNQEELKDLLFINLSDKKTKELKISEVSEEIINNKLFFGTNKIYKLGNLKKYEDDKGNVNYNFRIFTQF